MPPAGATLRGPCGRRVRQVPALPSQEAVDDGDYDKREHGGGHQAADDYRRKLRADDSTGLTLLKGKRQQHKARGQRRHQDGADASLPALDQGVADTRAAPSQLVHKGDQHDGVRDHKANQHQQSHQPGRLSARPVIKSAAIAPVNASGTAIRIISGVMNDRCAMNITA